MGDFDLNLLAITFILPVAIVLIYYVAKHRELSKKVELAKIAIEHGVSEQFDFSFLDGKKLNGVKNSLLNRLTWGAICTFFGIISVVMFVINDMDELWAISSAVCLAVGIGLLVAFFIGRKMFAHELEMEEQYGKAESEKRLGKITKAE